MTSYYPFVQERIPSKSSNPFFSNQLASIFSSRNRDYLLQILREETDGWLCWAAKERLERTGDVDVYVLLDVLSKTSNPLLIEDIQKKLEQAALYESNPTTRLKVIPHLSNKSVLKELALNDPDPEIRISALHNLMGEDQGLILEIAQTDDEVDVRRTAINYVIDQHILTELILSEEDTDLRLLSITYLSEDVLKMRIALEVDCEDTALSATKEISDQYYLVHLGLESDNQDIRCWALDQLSDENLMIFWSLAEEDNNLRYEAVERVQDHTMLADILIADGSDLVVEGVIDKINNQQLLQKILVNCKSSYTRCLATECIQDPEVLFEVAMNDHDYDVRRSAIYKLSLSDKQILLAEIGKQCFDLDTRKDAIRVIKDPGLFREVYHANDHPHVTIDMESRIFKPTTTERRSIEILKHETDPYIRMKAVKNIDNQNVLFDIIMNYQDTPMVRSQAIQRFKDMELLAEISHTDPYIEVQDCAIARLNHLKEQYVLIENFVTKSLPAGEQMHCPTAVNL